MQARVVQLRAELAQLRLPGIGAEARLHAGGLQHLGISGLRHGDAERGEQGAWLERCELQIARNRWGIAIEAAHQPALAAGLEAERRELRREQQNLLRGEIGFERAGEAQRLRLAAGQHRALEVEGHVEIAERVLLLPEIGGECPLDATLRAQLRRLGRTADELGDLEAQWGGIELLRRRGPAQQLGLRLEIGAHRIRPAEAAGQRELRLPQLHFAARRIAHDLCRELDLRLRGRRLARGLELALDLDRLVAVQPPGAERRQLDAIALRGAAIVVVDDDVLQRQPFDIEVLQTALLLRLVRSRRLFLPLRQIAPVVAPLGIDTEPHRGAVELHGAGLDAFLPEQGHELHAELGALHGQHRIGAEALGVAERRVPKLDAQPGEHREADLTDGEAAAGFALHGLADLPAIVGGVEQQRQRHDRREQQQQKRAEHGENDLERLGHRHGRVGDGGHYSDGCAAR